MDEFEIRRIIMDYIKEISHYSQLQVFATSYYQKNYFQLQIDEGINGLINFFITYNDGIMNAEVEVEEQGQNQQEPFDQPDQLDQVEEGVQQNQDQQNQGQENQGPQSGDGEERSFTQEDLAYYNGDDGKPAYVAVNGVVYDVSEKTRWARGSHFGLRAGQDLSDQFKGCHQGFVQVLNTLPKVGVLIG
jgi:predicted heme/steroid binding protein